jgi:hypothetical protein
VFQCGIAARRCGGASCPGCTQALAARRGCLSLAGKMQSRRARIAPPSTKRRPLARRSVARGRVGAPGARTWSTAMPRVRIVDGAL